MEKDFAYRQAQGLKQAKGQAKGSGLVIRC